MSKLPEIIRRRATSGDEQFMRVLHKATSRDLVIRQFGEWDDETQASLFSKRWVPGKFEILEIGGEAIGCICAVNHPDYLLLEQILVLPKYQNLGIGSSVIIEEIAKAQDQKKPVRLQVLNKNDRALALYERLGFQVCGTTDRHFIMST